MPRVSPKLYNLQVSSLPYTNMIKDNERYYCTGGEHFVGGPSTWDVIDWDQRRVVAVTTAEEQLEEDIAIEHFHRYNGQLSPDIFRIHLSCTGELISVDSDPQYDVTYSIFYPFLHDIHIPEGVKIVRRDELEELDRFGPHVDLVIYPLYQGEIAKKVNTSS
jgi:hypothetical protein